MASDRRTRQPGSTRSRSDTPRAKTARAPRKAAFKLGPQPFIIAFILIAVIAGIVIYSGIAPLYSGEITDGVMISGVDVSGMTPEEAFAALSAYANDRINDISVAIRYQGQTWNFGASELNARLDFSEVVNAAAAVARTGSLSQRKAEASAAKAGQYVFDTSMAVNSDNLEYYLNQIKEQIDVPAREPSMSLQCDGPDYTVPGYSFWAPGVDYSSLFVTTPGSDGLAVDVAATMELLRHDLADDYRADVELVVGRVQPENTEQSLRDNAVLLYHSSSKLRGSTDDRNWNIMTALLNFDGMVIAPEQVVSFNDTVGERTVARGYRAAHTIDKSGALVDDLGGGICQAATTLFNAAIKAGCQVIERNPHSWPLYYYDYDWGLDAMVNWGTSDMVFKNTTGGYLYIDFYYDYSHGKPSYVDVDIYGLPLGEGVEIVMETVKVSEEEPPAPKYEFKTEEQLKSMTFENEWTYDPAQNLMVYEWVTPRTGYVYDVFRIWKKDGAEFKREQLYTSVYKPIQGLYYTKAAPIMPTPTPPPSETPFG